MSLFSEITPAMWVCIVASFASVPFMLKLKSIEILAISTLWLNMGADIGSTIMILRDMQTVGVYNVYLPILALIVLFIYQNTSPSSSQRITIRIGMGLVLLVWGFFNLRYGLISDINYGAFVISAFIISGSSYWLMRSMVLKGGQLQPVILFFALGNFAYYSLALVAHYSSILKDFFDLEQKLVLHSYINDTGYILFSLMILTGIIWQWTRTRKLSY